MLIYGVGAALIVGGVTALERERRCRLPRWLARLGDTSYSLYLSHVPVMAVVGMACRRLQVAPSPVLHTVVLAGTFGTTLLTGMLSFRLIERPLLILLRDRRWRPAIPLPALQPVLRAVRVRYESR